MKLSELKDNEQGVIVKVRGYGAFRKRITEMGFVRGKVVTVIKNAPLKDPVEYNIMGYEISLRRSEASLIEVRPVGNMHFKDFVQHKGVLDVEGLKVGLRKNGKRIHVALVGNPNCGKTTLFNVASGSTEHVGNYSGVTVGAKKARCRVKNHKIDLVDLPGTYSLTAYSQEEKYVRNYIIDQTPDVVVNVVDASNLERNLYLTTQLIDMDIKVVIALNMYDELQQHGAKFDYEKLGRMLGIPIIPTVGSKGEGIDELFSKIIQVHRDEDPIVRHIHINYDGIVERSIKNIRSVIEKDANIYNRVSPRFLSLKLLEKDEEALNLVSGSSVEQELKDVAGEEANLIESAYNENPESFITDSKYGFIAGALKETYKESHVQRRKSTELIDSFLTHKLFGIPLFFLFMFITFYCTFYFGEYPKAWIETGVEFLGSWVSNTMADGTLKDLIVDGIIGGVGGVIVFLPNILLLFLFISFMEDTGYMARAAFITDKVMHKIGLHGKSFIPLIMGFGCNVPAIMATRTLENRNDRLLTMLINPFMSCSARIPVYILIIGAFFKENAAVVLFSMYGIGIVIAVIVARIFKRVIFKSMEAPFVMELPPYRVPVPKVIIRHMWTKAFQYLRKMGGTILVASIIIWALGYFPRNVEKGEIVANTMSVQAQTSPNSNMDINITTVEQHDHSAVKLKELQQERSYIGRIGKFISPVMEPLGFDWKMSVSVLTGVVAKEVIVSTMGVLYMADEEAFDLQDRLKASGVFNSLSAFVFMLFILIYFPCIAVLITVSKEAGWKWALFMAGYTTLLAWIMAFIVNNIGSLFV